MVRRSNELLCFKQVDKAYDYLVSYASVPERNMRFNVSCTGGKRGVYLREAHHLVKPSEIVVTIDPAYMEEVTGTAKHWSFCLNHWIMKWRKYMAKYNLKKNIIDNVEVFNV